jgi:Zn-finger nucleic acid-binding protein
MNCPVCEKLMAEEDFGGVQVDVCRDGCKGIWFDWLELVRLDENSEGAGAALEEALRSPRVNDADRGQLNCPKCGIPMQTHKYKSAKEVNVDECYGCGGFFLDSGELQEVRDNYMTEEEEEAYVQKLLEEFPEMQAMGEAVAAEKAQQREAAGRKLGSLLREKLSSLIH